MKSLVLSSIVAVSILVCGMSEAQGLGVPYLGIRDVQESSAANSWESLYNGDTINVIGGVVTYTGMPPGKVKYRIVIQDPTQTEWAGIEVKQIGGTLNVNVGDKIDLSNVLVEESRATTYLVYDAGSSASVISGGNSITPTVIAPSLLGVGLISANPAAAEKYEGMIVRVEGVTVGDMGLGSHADLYTLGDGAGSCYASDYMNQDRLAANDYHANTAIGASFTAVEGILEQYQKTSSGYDYYQVLTRSSADFVPEPATMLILLSGGAVLLRRRKK